MISHSVTYHRTASWCTAVALSVLVGMPTNAHEIVANDLHIQHPYTAEPPAGIGFDLPVYMVIRNQSGLADRLISTTSTFGTSVAIVRRDGRDAPVAVASGIALPVHSETSVGPKSAYILIHNLTQPLAGYEYFPMTLVFEKAGAVDIEVFVKDAAD